MRQRNVSRRTNRYYYSIRFTTNKKHIPRYMFFLLGKLLLRLVRSRLINPKRASYSFKCYFMINLQQAQSMSKSEYAGK